MLKSYFEFTTTMVNARLDENKKLLSWNLHANGEITAMMNQDLHDIRLAIDELDDLVTK
jgi:hypothetical protein